MTYRAIHQVGKEEFSTTKITGHFKMNWRSAKRLITLTENLKVAALDLKILIQKKPLPQQFRK